MLHQHTQPGMADHRRTIIGRRTTPSDHQSYHLYYILNLTQNCTVYATSYSELVQHQQTQVGTFNFKRQKARQTENSTQVGTWYSDSVYSNRGYPTLKTIFELLLGSANCSLLMYDYCCTVRSTQYWLVGYSEGFTVLFFTGSDWLEVSTRLQTMEQCDCCSDGEFACVRTVLGVAVPWCSDRIQQVPTPKALERPICGLSALGSQQ